LHFSDCKLPLFAAEKHFFLAAEHHTVVTGFSIAFKVLPATVLELHGRFSYRTTGFLGGNRNDELLLGDHAADAL
jgi:hypothetical protein